MQVYKILLQVTAMVQPVSCDEAYLDITGLGDPEEIAASIRAKILQATGCTASAGISNNMLLARLATKVAKPDGQHVLKHDQVHFNSQFLLAVSFTRAEWVKYVHVIIDIEL